MPHGIECPNPAYERILKHGIDRIIERKEKTIDTVQYNGYLNDRLSRKISMEAEKFYLNINRKLSEKDEICRDIMAIKKETEDEGYFSFNFVDLLIQYPGFLGFLVMKDELFNHDKYDFPSAKKLSEAVTSYYFGEVYLNDFRKMSWRNKNAKNSVSQNEHGDMYVSQYDVSGGEEKTLFGPDFKAIKKDCHIGAIAAYQDWSGYLLSALKYAEALGKAKIPEITNWKEVMKETGQTAGNYTEAMGMGGYDAHLNLMIESAEFLSEKMSHFPIVICNREDVFLPYFKDRKLIFFKESKDGEFELKTNHRYYNQKRFTKCLEYDEDDLIPILKANYRLYARDKGEMYYMMDKFVKKHSFK